MTRLALKDEYFCFGCRLFHKVDARPPVKGLKRAYCAPSHKRASERAGEMHAKGKQR